LTLARQTLSVAPRRFSSPNDAKLERFANSVKRVPKEIIGAGLPEIISLANFCFYEILTCRATSHRLT
jgi:hypothetical protein